MTLRQFGRNKLAVTGIVILSLIVLACVFVPMFMPFSVTETFPKLKNQSPSWEHWLGTDKFGRDVLYRVLVGGRISIMVGLCGTIVSLLIGVVLGIIAGYYRKWADFVIMRVVEMLAALPGLPLLLILAMLLSDMKVPPDSRIYWLMLILGIVGWTGVCRMVRGQLFSLREQEFIQATQALGLKDRRTIYRHMLPNVIPIIIVMATLGIAGGIVGEAGLSFLGLGVQIPNPSWGNMLQDAISISVIRRPWIWVPPGIFLLCTILSINLIGDGLRDAIDPKMKI
jgi:peptide/nickel transport system permease protein